jgi:hypothetical protein
MANLLVGVSVAGILEGLNVGGRHWQMKDTMRLVVPCWERQHLPLSAVIRVREDVRGRWAPGRRLPRLDESESQG